MCDGMVDREKVLAALELCASDQSFEVCVKNHCPYIGGLASCDCVTALQRDALALLKAQEPKLVHVTAKINYRKIGECPTCGKLINSGDYPNYCGVCGQAVKWG